MGIELDMDCINYMKTATTNQHIFISNVVYLLKRSGKLGQFEKMIGCAPGYFSRLQNFSRSITLDVALFATQYLDKSIEELCSPSLQSELKLAEIEQKLKELETKREELLQEVEVRNGNKSTCN